ncbi:hypothetical protein [Streptomyces vietnamensis]|uniref:UDP-N-acetylmuramyl pentapeptide phosphotransferase/UDP-N-acetylglucosamine-1-phosphate transferase n=1 Tax=Streptomyces vietnamensis TaxID=362257 RepID=A0A0B5I879_9ACTN|nr:hypothetical protein [Streptomyces vietnamensis]AJF64464.1 hypothetical protein SVTN_08540 [Streptomyces vietnamensis]
MTRAPGRIGTFAVAFGATRLAYGRLRRRPPGNPGSWERTNHAGRRVLLQAGQAAAFGSAVAALPAAPPAALAVAAAAACGRYDDLRGDHRRGFRAHLGALRGGEVTSGAVKLFGIGAASLAAGALLKEKPLDKVLAGVVIAGTAHLVNLVDVRPGRAGLLVLGLGAPGLLRGALAGAPMGAAAAVLGDDLGEVAMLGDAGAHALGAAVGSAIAASNGRLGLAAHAAGLVAAAVWGERAASA